MRAQHYVEVRVHDPHSGGACQGPHQADHKRNRVCLVPRQRRPVDHIAATLPVRDQQLVRTPVHHLHVCQDTHAPKRLHLRLERRRRW